MIRNVKTLGLAIVALLALSAVAASAGQASDHLRIGNGEGTGQVKIATHPNKTTQHLETDVGAVNCKEFIASYRGSKEITAAATLEEVSYGKCTLGGLSSTVNFGSCDYTLSSPIETVEEHGQGDVTIGPEGCTATIKSTVFDCTLTIAGSQTFENAITYTDAKTGEFAEVTGHVSFSGLAYSYSGTACNSGSNTNGVYEGTFTAKGYDTEGKQKGVAITDSEVPPSPSDHLRIGNGEGTGQVKISTHPDKATQHLETDVGAVDCKEFSASYRGSKEITAAATLEEVSYGKCTLAGLGAKVQFGTCDYTLSSPIETVEGHGQGDVTLGSEGCAVMIESTVIDCTVEVEGEQSFEDALTYTPVETGEFKEITGHVGAGGVAYSYSGTACGSGSNTNGVYEGTFTAQGFSPESCEEPAAQTDLKPVET